MRARASVVQYYCRMSDDDDAGPRRMVVTLAPEAAEATRKMATELGCSSPEAIRRGLVLLHLVTHLSRDESLAIHNSRSGQFERVRLLWSVL